MRATTLPERARGVKANVQAIQANRMILEIVNNVGTVVTNFLQGIGKESLGKGVDAVKCGAKGLGGAVKGIKFSPNAL